MYIGIVSEAITLVQSIIDHYQCNEVIYVGVIRWVMVQPQIQW
jgi:hypothetical protein